MTDTMTAMGEHIDARLSDIERAALRTDDAIAAADTRARQAQAESAALSARVTALEAAIQTRRRWLGQPLSLAARARP